MKINGGTNIKKGQNLTYYNMKHSVETEKLASVSNYTIDFFLAKIFSHHIHLLSPN